MSGYIPVFTMQFYRDTICSELKKFRARQDSGTLNGYSVDSLVQDMSKILVNCSNAQAALLSGPPPGLGHGISVETCAICKDTDDSREKTSVSCGHEFHSDCLRRWLIESSTCPVCRSHSLMAEDYPQLGR